MSIGDRPAIEDSPISRRPAIEDMRAVAGPGADRAAVGARALRAMPPFRAGVSADRTVRLFCEVDD